MRDLLLAILAIIVGLTLAWVIMALIRRRYQGAASGPAPRHRRARRPVMSGKQAALCGGAAAVLVDFAWRAVLTGDWTPTAAAGSALSVLLIALFDIWLAGGTPTDDAAAFQRGKDAAAAELEASRETDRAVLAARIRAAPERG